MTDGRQSTESDAAQRRIALVEDRRRFPVAVAESLTGGLLSAQVARITGAGDWFRGGLVAYSSDVKYDLLGVPEGPVVSAIAAEAMAKGAASLLGADVAVALTGVGGPDPQDGDPPGTVWMGTFRNGITDSRLLQLSGSPETICEASCDAALSELAALLEAAAMAIR